MSESNSNQENPVSPSSDSNSTPSSMVTPRNQVVLDASNPPATPAPATTPAASSPANADPVNQPTAQQPSEVAWPDTQEAVTGTVEPLPAQPAVKSSSKSGLIIILLIALGVAIGVYVALGAL